MPHTYVWKSNEANFGPPVNQQVAGGLHITFEIILKFKNKFVALRRPNAIPGHHERPNKNGDFLYFCNDLIRYGESVEACVKRIVKEQAGVDVMSYKVFDIDSVVQEKDKQWAFTPHVLAELASLPKRGVYGNEVVQFTKRDVPDDFGWWKAEELKDFFEELIFSQCKPL